MIAYEGQVYRCQNPACAAEIKIIKASRGGEFNFKCCCGGVMKKPYSKPLFKVIAENDQAACVFLVRTEQC